MALFRYEATDPRGKTLRGAMDAASIQEVQARLSGRGYRGVQVLETAPSGRPAPAVCVGGWKAAAPSEALGLFFRQLGALAETGFTPSAALSDLSARTACRPLAQAGQRLAQATGRGESLAGAMAQQGGLFPAQMVGLVAAGETGGFLPFAFEEAALGAEQDTALRQGMGWPRFLAWQGVWSVLLFQPLLPSLDLENPLGSLARYARAVALMSIPVGIGCHAAAWLTGRALATPALAGIRDRLTLAFPLSRRLATRRALAAFTRVLRRLLAAGIGPETAFAAAAEAAPNGLLRTRLQAGVPVLRAAGGLDAAIQATGLFDHDRLQLLITGQKAGRWTETLEQVTAFYQEEAAQATDAVRRAQQRAGVLIALITSGYLMIAATAGLASLGLRLTRGWTD